jgi:hypothetical protein
VNGIRRCIANGEVRELYVTHCDSLLAPIALLALLSLLLFRLLNVS